MSFNLNRKEAAAIARGVGLTLRWNAEWGEYQLYPKGVGVESPDAYFTNCLEDALCTARFMVEDKTTEAYVRLEAVCAEFS